MLSRRTVLIGGVAVAAAGVVSFGVQQGVVPGCPWLQDQLGLNGDAGVVPDVEPGPVEEGMFVSEARGGLPTGLSLIRPLGVTGPLPLVVALHALGADHTTLTSARFALDRYLTAAVAAGVPPFAIATVDGGTTYWHPRPSGEDAGAMVTDELLPLLADREIDTTRLGFLGWSMGGYGALRLGAQLGPERVPALAAVSSAIWTEPADASESGFETRRSTKSSPCSGTRRSSTASRCAWTAGRATRSTAMSRTTWPAFRTMPT